MPRFQVKDVLFGSTMLSIYLGAYVSFVQWTSASIEVKTLFLFSLMGLFVTCVGEILANTFLSRKAGKTLLALRTAVPWKLLIGRSALIFVFSFIAGSVDASIGKFTVFWIICLLDSILTTVRPTARLHVYGVVLWHNRLLRWKDIELTSRRDTENCDSKILMSSRQGWLAFELLAPSKNREQFDQILTTFMPKGVN